jgi:PTH1 family peptidyl-tRNA hydrolase
VKLLVGLGNPGSAYDGTRHNVGFEVLEILARRAGSPSRRARFQGEAAQASIRGCPVLLLWPLTWMNLSGSSVLAARDFYKIGDSDILVLGRRPKRSRRRHRPAWDDVDPSTAAGHRPRAVGLEAG